MANIQELRICRHRLNTLDVNINNFNDTYYVVNSRKLVQVYNGGMFPATSDKIYLTHPVDLDGPEAEGISATPIVDTTTSIPVVVLWGVPQVGDLLTAYAVGGRWVAERAVASDQQGYPCGQCQIPKKNLTVSWANLILGNASTTLIYSGSPTTRWISQCSNELFFQLLCTQNQVEFQVHYFLFGSCPTGEGQYCSTSHANPYKLVQTNLSCSPFLLTCNVTSSSCPYLASYGYTGFTISY